MTLREKCPCPDFFWSVFSRIRTETGQIWSIGTFHAMSSFVKPGFQKQFFFWGIFKWCLKLGSRDAENNYKFCQFIFNFRQVLFASKS